MNPAAVILERLARLTFLRDDLLQEGRAIDHIAARLVSLEIDLLRGELAAINPETLEALCPAPHPA